jgi:DNA-binding CsgD family transcriptional regulator
VAWSLATSARCRALVQAARGDVNGAIDALERAMREHDRLAMPFERGRTLFVKGRIERRAKRKASARASLEQALAVFDGLPAPLWAARAAEELRRVGLRPQRAFDLTETEKQVAELAASGLKNREVAAQLYISPKTVEANLARVYGKLGIRSRAELGSRLGRMGTSAPQR